MRILILGATGMLGHKLMQVLSKQFSVTGTVRGNASDLGNHPVFTGTNIIGYVRADDLLSVQNAIEYSKPDEVINCIGIVKQLPAAQDPLPSIAINGCLTIRTSIIGPELETKHGLIEWFLSQEGKTVSGYKKAVFSGLTTLALSEIIAEILADHPHLSGIYQVASEPISKYDLLNLVKKTYDMKIKIDVDETIINNRSLNPEKFKKETNIKIPSWEYMIEEMYRDPTPYAMFRGHHA